MVEAKPPSSIEPSSYPKSIAFIISNEFCERFNYYGMRTILVLYMTMKLGYSDDAATILFHVFTSLVYFFPILGAILADSYLGKFKTILYLSCVYSLGSALISIGAIPILHLPAQTLTVIGLILIGLGSGGIKPCVSAFGGDQFKIPEQAKQLATFFSFFYFSINAGSLISTTLTPILREDVKCFGDDDCFSLAFGVPCALMLASIVVFVFGKNLYVVKKPAGNVIVDVTKCIMHAVTEKSKQSQKLPHWLDFSEQKFGRRMVSDIKSVLKVLLLFVPLPFFWALFDQQGSRWTFQATRMDGNIGFFDIKPDQMQVINPLLILIFIPIFDVAVYPLLSKIGLRRPLQKLAAGGILAGLAFLVSGFVELELEKTYPVYPAPNESQLRFFNGLPCDYAITSSAIDGGGFSMNMNEMAKHSVKTNQNISQVFTFAPSTGSCRSFENDFRLHAGVSDSFFIYGSESSPQIRSYEEKIDKSKNGFPSLRILANVGLTAKTIKFLNNKNGISKEIPSTIDEQIDILPSSYTVLVDDVELGKVDLLLGGVYTLIISKFSEEDYELQTYVITPPNTVHMLWLIPQFVIMTAGEVMFSVTGLEFAYSQAPSTMKSFLQACWLLTVAFGNVIVVIIAEAKFFQSQAYEFFLFAAMMFIDMGIFILLALRYKYVTNTDKTSDEVDAENAIPIEDKRKTFTNNAFSED